MPIKRKLAKEIDDDWNIVFSLAKNVVREVEQPLSDSGWKLLISREIEIDIEITTRVFEKLIEEGVLSFVRKRGKRTIYVNDRTPEFKRYMWSGDLNY